MHFKTIFKSLKNKDMLRRVGIIFGILIAYRLLAQIPVPMGDASTFREAVSNLLEKSDFSSFLNLISGGGLASFSIILVGLSPYITGSIIIQLLTKAIPSLEELSNDGESGRRKINQWTRILTVPLAIVQSVARWQRWLNRWAMLTISTLLMLFIWYTFDNVSSGEHISIKRWIAIVCGDVGFARMFYLRLKHAFQTHIF